MVLRIVNRGELSIGLRIGKGIVWGVSAWLCLVYFAPSHIPTALVLSVVYLGMVSLVVGIQKYLRPWIGPITPASVG